MNTDGSKTKVELLKELKDLRQRLVRAEAVEKDLKREVEKAADLTSFTELNPNPVLELGQKGNIKYTNPAAIRLFPDLASLGARHPFLSDWAQVVRELQSNNWTKTAIRNVVVENLVYEQLLYPVTENRIRIYGLNITERKKAEQELFIRNQILNNLLEGVNFVRLNGQRIMYTNPKFDEMFGYHSGELIGKHVNVLYAPGELTPEDTAAYINRELNKHDEWRGEIYCVRKDGSGFWCQTIVTKFTHPEYGEIVVSVHEDITRHKLAEDVLRESEEKYRLLIENSHDIIYTLSSDGIFTFVSPAWSVLLGHPLSQVVGQPFQKFVHPDDLQSCLELFQSVIKTKQRQENVVYRVRHADGSWRWHTSSGDAFKDAAGAFFYHGIARDITESKKVEEALRDSEALYRDTFDNVPIGIFRSTMDGKFIIVNHELAEMLGFDSPAEMISLVNQTNIAQALYVDSQKRGRIINYLKAKPGWSTYENEYRHKDGSILVGRLNTRIILNPNGTVDYIEGMVENITERKQAEDNLLKSEKMNRLLADFNKKLNDISIRFGEAADTADLFEKIAESFRFLTGACASSFAIYDQESRALKVLSLSIDPKSRERVISMFGTDLFKMQIPVSTDDLEQMLTLGIRRPQDLNELSSGKVPKDISDSVMDAIECRQIVALAISYGGDMIGTCIAYLQGDQAVVPDETLKTFISLSGIAIKRKRAEDALRENEDKFRSLFNNMTEGFDVGEIILDDKGIPVDYKFLEVNPAFEKMSGLFREKIVGKTIKEIFPDLESFWIETFGRVALTGKPILFERRAPTTGKWLEVYAYSPQKGRFAALFRDIALRKQTEAKTLELEALKLINQAKSDLLANVSHELRTPLASIKGFIETLIEKDVKWSKKQQLDFLQSANAQADRLTLLIRDLLDMSRLDSGKLTLDRRSYPVSEILGSVSGVLSIVTEKRKLKIVQAPDLPSIQADIGRIGQVLTNLAENAVKFSAQGSLILLEVKTLNENVIFSVQDSGIGMPPEVVARLFDRFYQAQEIVSGKTQGTGLGLTICKGIVEAHGGQIWVESQPGQGSKFSFSIPLDAK